MLASADRFAAASESRLRQWQEAEGTTLQTLGGDVSAETPVDPAPAPRGASAEALAADRVTDADALLDLINDRIRRIDGVDRTEILSYLRLVKQTYNWGTG